MLQHVLPVLKHARLAPRDGVASPDLHAPARVREARAELTHLSGRT
jgi:hypothetical protein